MNYEHPNCFEDWLTDVGVKWTHVPGLKGRLAKRNLGILLILIIEGKPLSSYELTLEYMKLTDPNFSHYEKSIRAKKRVFANVVINKRISFLVDNQYLSKLYSFRSAVYVLSLKGALLMMSLNPKKKWFLPAVPENSLENFTKEIINSAEIAYKRLQNNNGNNKLSDTQYHRIIKFGMSQKWKNRLYNLKINLDAIDLKELWSLIREEFSK